MGTLIAAIAKRLAIDEMRAIADSLNRCALSPASHGLVASKKDFKKIVGFGNILDYWSGYSFGSFSFDESGEHLRGCWDISERFWGWFCFVVHAVKEVVFHVLIVHDSRKEVNSYLGSQSEVKK